MVMGNPQISTLEVSGELKNATAVIAWVDSELKRGGVFGETASDILICVDEAFSNIVFHSCKHQGAGVDESGGLGELGGLARSGEAGDSAVSGESGGANGLGGAFISGGSAGSGGIICISLSVNAQESVTVVFCDDAEALTFPSVKPQLGQTVMDRPTPGVGVYIMRQLMDEVIYQRDGDTNCLTLMKKLK